MAILAIFSPSLGDLNLTNESGANTQKENILAGNWFNFGNFQNLFGRSSKNKGFFLKSSTRGGVYLGFSLAPSITRLRNSLNQQRKIARIISLLVMDINLVEVMQRMSIEEHKPIIIPEDDTYCAMERGRSSLLGRLLNPEAQNMSRMLRTMPKIWKVYERVRGIALSRDRFQFVFDLETDIDSAEARILDF